jgi:hypothetical protein
MTDTKKPLQGVFAPGAFDNLDVESQEELDAMIAEIKTMFENPDQLMEMSTPVDLEELWETDPNLAELLTNRLNELDNDPRKLQ